MDKKNVWMIIISVLCVLLFFPALSVHARIEKPVAAEYEFELYMARGKLSVSDNYYETAIKNFRKAIEIKADSAHARDWLEKAITLKKLGIVNEAAESG